MMKRLLFAFSALLLILPACKKDSVIPPDPFYRDYFPTQVGSYITYDCDSIVYDDFNNTVDTFRFQIKEYYQSEFTDNAGRRAIRLERYKKTSDTTSWFLKDVWFVTATDNQVEKIEEDVRYIKLVFPVKDGKEWNGNALNSLGDRTYVYENAHKPYSTGALSFDSTVTTINTDPENLVSEYRNTETFAARVGMVYKRYVDVEYVVPGPAIRKGVIFTMKAVEIGEE
jgi:hypothetical protein